MKIAILGAGNVGSALGLGWAKAGHEVFYGARKPADPELKELVRKSGGKARAGTLREAAAASEVVVLATPWSANRQALEAAGPLEGKVLVDCTNPLKPDLSGLDVGHVTSGAEQVAQWSRGAKVVKAFNTTGSNNMENPRFGDRRAMMPVCSDDDAARKTVMRLAEDLGFEPVDAGGLQAARWLEPAAMLWIHLAFGRKMGRDFAFGLLRR